MNPSNNLHKAIFINFIGFIKFKNFLTSFDHIYKRKIGRTVNDCDEYKGNNNLMLDIKHCDLYFVS